MITPNHSSFSSVVFFTFLIFQLQGKTFSSLQQMT